MNPTFRPTAWQAAMLAALTFVAVGCALYLRHRVIQSSEIGIACAGGLQTTFCRMRGVVVFLFDYSVFGWVALGAAVLHLARPSAALLAIGLIAGGFGVVLYNVTLSAFAVALMILGFARPARRAA